MSSVPLSNPRGHQKDLLVSVVENLIEEQEAAAAEVSVVECFAASVAFVALEMHHHQASRIADPRVVAEAGLRPELPVPRDLQEGLPEDHQLLQVQVVAQQKEGLAAVIGALPFLSS